MTTSEFYQGHNIISTLKNSSFGKIKTIFQQLADEQDILKDYTLPKVLLIGNETAGKSSLIENITKCQIFTRGPGFCTRAPVRLVLKNGIPSYSVTHTTHDTNLKQVLNFVNKYEIHCAVDNIMNSIPVTKVCEAEIIVEITDADMPNFEFIDLPGIKEFPKEIAEATINITRKYLETNKDSIIICVVPCSTQSLTSCRSIAFIKEYDMEQNCILALTMMDKVCEDDIEELLVKRLIGVSDELNSFKFAGVVGVINRLHKNSKSLIDNDVFEEKWINEKVINCLPTQYIDYKETINNRTTLPKLLQVMDKIYTSSIKNIWKPKIIESLTSKQDEIIKKISDLGVETFTTDEVTKFYQDFFVNMLKNLKTDVADFDLYNLKMKTDESSTNGSFNLYISKPDLSESYISNSIKILNFKKIVRHGIEYVISKTNSTIIHNINTQFYIFHSAAKISRFSKILSNLLIITETIIRDSIYIIDQFCEIIDSYFNSCLLTNTTVTDDNIKNILNNFNVIYERILLEQNFNKCFETPFVFTEDQQHTDIRKKHVDTLQSYKLCLNDIEKMI